MGMKTVIKWFYYYYSMPTLEYPSTGISTYSVSSQSLVVVARVQFILRSVTVLCGRKQ